MRAPSALPRFRALAESRMLSTAVVRRKVAGDWVEVLTSKARLHPAGRGAEYRPNRLDAAGETWAMQGQRAISFPASTADLLDGDQVSLTAGENAGSFWRITESAWQDQSTARRVPVLQIAGADDAGFFNTITVTVRTYVGVNAFGAQYADPQTLTAWVASETHLSAGHNADTVSASTVILAPLASADVLIEGSLVMVPGDDRERRVMKVATSTVTGLLLPEHVEVHLS